MILQFLAMAGPFILPLILLVAVIVILAMKNTFRLRRADPAHAGRLRGSIDAILFWGGVAAVLGFLGQWVGLYKATQAVAELGLSPVCAENPARCYAIGFAESLTTTIFGLTVLLLASLVWFALRSRVRHLTAAA